jgi:hypothetical protein
MGVTSNERESKFCGLSQWLVWSPLSVFGTHVALQVVISRPIAGAATWSGKTVGAGAEMDHSRMQASQEEFLRARRRDETNDTLRQQTLLDVRSIMPHSSSTPPFNDGPTPDQEKMFHGAQDKLLLDG